MLTQEYLQTLYAQAQLLWQPLSPYTPPSWHFLAHYLGPGEVDHYYAFARSYLAPYRTYILICAILCVATALYPIFARCLTRTSRIAQSRNALQAMLYVLTPTRSVWPQHYITAAKSTAYSQRKTLQLSLRNTVDDVLSGRMELRAPQQDIPYLLRNALEVDGWTLGLHIDRSWRLDLIRWVLAAQFAPSMSKVSVAKCSAMPCDTTQSHQRRMHSQSALQVGRQLSTVKQESDRRQSLRPCGHRLGISDTKGIP